LDNGGVTFFPGSQSEKRTQTRQVAASKSQPHPVADFFRELISKLAPCSDLLSYLRFFDFQGFDFGVLVWV
jgi:hypothetical protein